MTQRPVKRAAGKRRLSKGHRRLHEDRAMPDSPERTESIFFGAAALASAEERAAYLNEACGGDAALREEVEALLRAHERVGHMLDRVVPGGNEQTGAYIPSEEPGALI